MKITQILDAKNKDNWDAPGATIAFLGDSVTQGCFEIYWRTEEALDTVFENENSYSRHVADILSMLYPKAAPAIINAGISGDNAVHAVTRLEQDVLSHKPDLTVVALGINDCVKADETPEEYLEALGTIFDRLREAGSEIIFLTGNMMCTSLSPFVKDPKTIEIIEDILKAQQAALPDQYFDAAKALCAERGIPVCDCYKIWRSMDAAGVNITELLANKANHPIRPLTWLFAVELVKTMLMTP